MARDRFRGADVEEELSVREGDRLDPVVRERVGSEIGLLTRFARRRRRPDGRSVVPEQPPDGLEFRAPGADNQGIGATVRDDHRWAGQPRAREDVVQDAGQVARVRVLQSDDVHIVRCELHVEPLDDLSDPVDVCCRIGDDEQVGQRRGLCTKRWSDYFSRRFRECLDRLALLYGFATEHPVPIKTLPR